MPQQYFTKDEWIALHVALNDDNPNKIQALLSPEFIVKVADPPKLNIVHYAVMHATLVIQKIIFKYITEQDQSALLLQRDREGDTPLHYAAQTGSLKIVNNLLYFLKQKANEAAKTLNNLGKLPIEKIKSNAKNKEQIFKKLHFHQSFHELRYFNEPLDEKLLLARYPGDAEHEKLLSDCCKISNLIRTKSQSPSHPSSPKKEQKENHRSLSQDLRLDIIREGYDKKIQAINDKYVKTSLSRELKKITQDEIDKELAIDKTRINDRINAISESLDQENILNCGDLQSVFLRYFINMYPQVRCNEVNLVNGNHALVIINLAPLYDRTDCSTWGAKAFFVDVWAGEIFHASEALNKVKYLMEYSIDDPLYPPCDIVGPCNLAIHQFDFTSGYSNVHAFEILQELKLDDQQKFLMQKTINDMILAHTIIDGAFPLLQIFFKLLDNLKNNKFVQTMLESRDAKNHLPLHYVSLNQDPRSIRIVLAEYKKYFSSLLPAMMFGDKFENFSVLTTAIENRNFAAINEILDFFKEDELMVNKIKQQFEYIFLYLVKYPKKLNKQLEFMLSCSNLIRPAALKKGFLKVVNKDNRRLLQNICQQRFSEMEQRSIFF